MIGEGHLAGAERGHLFGGALDALNDIAES